MKVSGSTPWPAFRSVKVDLHSTILLHATSFTTWLRHRKSWGGPRYFFEVIYILGLGLFRVRVRVSIGVGLGLVLG